MSNLVPLPGSDRPVDAIRHIGHVISERDIRKVLVITVDGEDELELFGFGPDVTRGEFAYAGARLTSMSLSEYVRER